MTPFIDAFTARLAMSGQERAREGNDIAAGVYRKIAADLRKEFADYLDAELSLDEAATESGYHAESLRKLASTGQWSGTRRDLPRSPDRRKHRQSTIHAATV